MSILSKIFMINTHSSLMKMSYGVSFISSKFFAYTSFKRIFNRVPSIIAQALLPWATRNCIEATRILVTGCPILLSACPLCTYGNTFHMTGLLWGKSTSHQWIPSKRGCGALISSLLLSSTRYWTHFCCCDLRCHDYQVTSLYWSSKPGDMWRHQWIRSSLVK